MIEIFGTIAMVLAIFGVVLNNRKRIYCFYFWMVSNAITGGIHYNAEIYSLLVRDLIFFVLAIEGIYQWRKRRYKKQG